MMPFLIFVGGSEKSHAQGAPVDLPYGNRYLTEKEASDVSLAIEDEIYDYSQQKFYFNRKNSKKITIKRNATIELFINPRLSGDGGGQVIYNNLPYGEVIRIFYILHDGSISLTGGPHVGFPITQPSHLTIFEDKSDIYRRKINWLHKNVIIFETPRKSIIIEAANRQLKRVGFSSYLGIWREGNKLYPSIH